MGLKYTTQSASGYNASPPSDDGTAVASNEVKWSIIKPKLADPVKDLADNINTALLTHIDESVLDKGTAYTTTAADHKRTINVTAAATQSLGDAATMAVGYIVTIKNSHTAAITVDLVTGADTLDGTAAGSLSLDPDASVTVIVNSSADGYLIKSIATGDISDLTITGEIDAATVGDGIIDALYPVGSIYTNRTDSTNPATLLGGTGTWTAIEDVFLIGRSATYTTGGGSANAIVVAHTHTAHTIYDGGGSDGPRTRGTSGSSAQGTVATSNAGSNGTGKNMPPYEPVYMWERTA